MARAKRHSIPGYIRHITPGEGSAPYNAVFEAENDDIDLENTHFWDVNNK
jgi:hypothetical protein